MDAVNPSLVPFSCRGLITNANTQYDNTLSFICLSVSGSVVSELFFINPTFAPDTGERAERHQQHSPAPAAVLGMEPRALYILESVLPLSDNPSPNSFSLTSDLIAELSTILGRPLDSGRRSVVGNDLRKRQDTQSVTCPLTCWVWQHTGFMGRSERVGVVRQDASVYAKTSKDRS